MAKKPVGHIQEEDSDEDSEEDDEPVTKPKATTSQVKKAQPAKKVEDDDDEDEDEEEEVKAPAKQTPNFENNQSGQEYEAKIFGLSYQSTDNDIKEFLKDCGPINNVNLLKDRNTGRSRGIAFVKFSTEEALNAALELNGAELMGRYLEISKPEPRNFDGGQKSFGQRDGGGYNNKPSGGAGGESSTCFIGNLSYTTTAETLRSVFEQCGGIIDVRIAMDKNTGEVIDFF